MIYGLESDGKTLRFHCDDEKVFNDILDYIERYIDADRWRSTPKVITMANHPDEPLEICR